MRDQELLDSIVREDRYDRIRFDKMMEEAPFEPLTYDDVKDEPAWRYPEDEVPYPEGDIP